MAILTGIENGLSKSVGEWTFAHVKNQTVVKQKVRKPATPTRTYLTQKHRGQMANVDNFWSCTDGLLKYTMEKTKDSQAEQNVFVKANLASSPVYLTKAECQARTCLLYPYVVSSGTLDSIAVTEQSGKLVSSLSLGSLSIGPSTTKGELVMALLDSNPVLNDLKWDVRIVFYRATQLPAEGSRAATVRLDHKDLNLNPEDNSKTLAELGLSDGFDSVAIDGVNYLCCNSVANTMACWCWSKSVYGLKPDKRMCSTQRLVGPENPLLAQYTSKRAMYNCILSLGGVNKNNIASPEYDEYLEFVKDMRREALLGDTDQSTPAPTYTLTVVANPSGKATFTLTPEGPYHEGDQVQVRVTPASGYTFSGWQGGGSQNPRTVTIGRADQTLTANLTATSSGGGAGDLGKVHPDDE